MNSTIYSSLSFLRKIHACDEAISYASTQSDFQSIWDNCPRGDWLIWLASLLRAPQKLVVQVSIECLRLALPYLSKNESEFKDIINKCNEWVNGSIGTRKIKLLHSNIYHHIYELYPIDGDSNIHIIHATVYLTEAIIRHDPSDLAAYSYDIIMRSCLANPDTNIEMLNNCANIVRQIIKIDDLNVSLLDAQN